MKKPKNRIPEKIRKNRSLKELRDRNREIRMLLFRPSELSYEQIIELRRELSNLDLKIESQKRLIDGEWQTARKSSGTMLSKNLGGKKDVNR